MTEKSALYGQEEALDYMGRRTIASTCPPLAAYLHPGVSVLDVGCGPGSITRDIARQVQPGSVTGLDVEGSAIARAREMAATSQASNVTFQVADAQQPLDFADAVFDLTTCVNALWLFDERVRVLREWARVTRPGGWVVANLGDAATEIRYPPCPAWERWRKVDLTDAWSDVHLGRKAYALFAEAGFDGIRVVPYAPPEFCVYPGAAHFDWIVWVSGYQLQPDMPRNQKFIAAGQLDKATLQAAQQELDDWARHPHAFYVQVPFLLAGRVP